MKKKLLILFTLIMVLTMALTITATCFAEEEVDNVVYENETLVDNSVDTTQSEQTSDNNANLWFSKIWQKGKAWCIGAFSGITIGGIIATIIYGMVKGFTAKATNTITTNCNSKDIADQASNKILDKLANVALDVNIAPVLQSQYKAISEEINAELNINLNKQDKKNLAVIKCFEAFADYFKCSVAVSEEQKQALADTINEAKALYENCDNKATAKIEIVAEAPKETKKEAKVVENY